MAIQGSYIFEKKCTIRNKERNKEEEITAIFPLASQKSNQRVLVHTVFR